MRRFVKIPNLPKDCAAVIYGEKYAEILQKALNHLQVESFLLPDNPEIDPRLAGHTDLSVFHAEGNLLFLAPYLKGSAFAATLNSNGLQLAFPIFRQGSEYPLDARLNICAVGRYVICNLKTAESLIVEYLTKQAMKCLLPVRQGYSRCAICVVDAHSIITEDRGIAVAAEAAGMQVLLIRPGYIRLDGFPYGFIGGAAFKLASDKLAFTGYLNAHPDREAILSFLAEREIEVIYLTKEPVFDIGSAVPIIEN